MNPQHRALVCFGTTVLFGLPVLAVFGFTMQGKWNSNRGFEEMKQASEYEIQQALERAKSCIPLDPSTPLTNHAYVHYKYQSYRPLPSGAIVCDNFGHTAIVDESAHAADIKAAPQEQVNKILQDRDQQSRHHK